MDIRTKLIFALVAVALTSMIAMGVVVSSEVDGFLRQSRLDRLDELAESRRQALLWIVEGWRDRADLIASRTQLRASLDEHGRTGDAAAAARIRTILDDAIEASRSARLVRVHDRSGALVAAVTRGGDDPLPSRALSASPIPPGDTRYVGVEFDGSGAPQVTFTAPLEWNDSLVGTLVSVFDASELLELTGAFQGLGESGETLVFVRDADGSVRTLHPTRHIPGGGGGVVLPTGRASIASRALSGEPQPASDQLIDYRGEEVWAATRFVDDTGWGLAVKVDAFEEELPYTEFRDRLRRTALILAAFAILAGFAFGMRFALPIHQLAEVANRIRGGEMQARAKVTVEDEVGQLARNFNEMADELEQRMELMREFRKFFEVSIDLMCIAGTDGYFKRVNPAFTRKLGWTEDELLQRPFFDFVHPDDVDATQAEVAKLAEGIPTISFDNRYLCKDGTYKLLRWASYPEAGRLYAVAHVMDDSPPT